MKRFERSLGRILLFALGCIGSRLALVALAKHWHASHAYLGIGCIFVSIGFFLLASGLVCRDTGQEVSGEQIWWKPLRWVHATTYMLAGLMLLNDDSDTRRHAWKVLLLDVAIGGVAFTCKVLGVV